MRFRCANGISIFFRSRRDLTQASAFAISRATSRACCWIERGTLRAGIFGQHRGFGSQASQSCLLVRQSSPRCRRGASAEEFGKPGVNRRLLEIPGLEMPVSVFLMNLQHIGRFQVFHDSGGRFTAHFDIR